MLTHAELLHFSEHGWVVLEGAFDDGRCRAYIEALDQAAASRKAYRDEGPVKTRLDMTILFDELFLDWLRTPAMLAANRQILGTQIRATEFFAYVTTPEPGRADSGSTLRDPTTWGWHRGFRRRFANLPSERDERLLNCLYTTNITYLTPVSPGSGSTAVLDGSHLLDDDWQTLLERCPLLEPEAGAGDVLIIAETLMHSAVPIVSEQTRYALLYCFVPPWFANWPGYDVPPALLETLQDEELKTLLGPPHYRGQQPEA